MPYFTGKMPWTVLFSVNKEMNEGQKKNYFKFKRRCDAMYECEHQTIFYSLESDQADAYYLPNPVCVNCKRQMHLVELFNADATTDRNEETVRA